MKSITSWDDVAIRNSIVSRFLIIILIVYLVLPTCSNITMHSSKVLQEQVTAITLRVVAKKLCFLYKKSIFVMFRQAKKELRNWSIV